MMQLLSHIALQLRVGVRDAAYMFTSIVLPAGLYWFFAVPESNSPYAAVYLTGSFCAFSFFGVVFLQYAIHTAQERNSPWSQYLSTLPIRPHVIIFARFITSVLLGTLACSMIYLVSKAFTPSDLSLPVFAQMMGLLTLGSLPFLLMGLVVGNAFNEKAVVPVANFIHLVLSFAGGLWKPPEILPEAIQKITPWLPTYHYGILAWSLSSEEVTITTENVVYLAGFALAMTALLCLQKLRGK